MILIKSMGEQRINSKTPKYLPPCDYMFSGPMYSGFKPLVTEVKLFSLLSKVALPEQEDG